MGVEVGAITATSQTVTGMDSRPRFVLFMGTNQTTFEVVITGASLGGFLGFASNDEFGSETITNYCEFVMLSGGTCSNLSETACYAQSSPGSFGANNVYRGVVTSFNDDGFTISFDVSSPSHTVFYMAFTGADGSASLLYERSCDGVLVTDIGVGPSLVFALGQWRDTCHTLPKSTSTLPWYSYGMCDVTSAEYMYQAGGRSVINQRRESGINQPGPASQIGGENRPFVFGTAIALGYLRAQRSGTDLTLTGETGGNDYAIGVLSEDCNRADVGKVTAQTPGTTQNFALDEIGTTPEAVFFINMESEPVAGADQSFRTGFGFSDATHEYGFLIDQQQGCMVQSLTRSWIPSVTPTTWSAGTVDYTPTSGNVGFTTESNDAGAGASGWAAIKTFCEERGPLLVSFSGFFQNRPSGSQLTLRGGVFIEGEGEPVSA